MSVKNIFSKILQIKKNPQDSSIFLKIPYSTEKFFSNSYLQRKEECAIFRVKCNKKKEDGRKGGGDLSIMKTDYTSMGPIDKIVRKQNFNFFHKNP